VEVFYALKPIIGSGPVTLCAFIVTLVTVTFNFFMTNNNSIMNVCLIRGTQVYNISLFLWQNCKAVKQSSMSHS